MLIIFNYYYYLCHSLRTAQQLTSINSLHMINVFSQCENALNICRELIFQLFSCDRISVVSVLLLKKSYREYNDEKIDFPKEDTDQDIRVQRKADKLHF